MRTASRTVEIRAVAVDEVSGPNKAMSRSFKETERAAKNLDRQVASSEGKFKRLGQAIKKHSAELTAGARAAVRMASDVSASGRATEQALFAIQAAYVNTAQDWVSWSGRMQEATIYSDEAFMQSAENMKTLIDNYGLTEDQVKELISASADLAAVKGIDVYDATTRLQSAIRGEAEASEYLGLTLNDTYMKNKALGGSLKDTWEKLDDNTKAQYRYQEALKQAAYAQGKATAASGTADGQYKRLQNSIQDITAQLGQAINKSGPWIQVLEDGMGLIDTVLPLYTALKLAKIADTGATVTHTAAQVADNAAMAGGATAVEGLAGALGGGGGLTGVSGAAALASGGLVVALGEVALALAAVAAGAWVTKEAVEALNKANYEAEDSGKIATHQITLARRALDEGRISYEDFVRISREAAQIMGDAPLYMTPLTDGFLNLKQEADLAATAIETVKGNVAGLGLVMDNLPEWPYKGIWDDEAKKMDNQKKAYLELETLPAQRAAAEKRWNAIILEAAKRSDDQRVTAARAALANEDQAWAATLAKRKADQTSHDAWVAAETQRIVELRKAGAWDTAWYAEQTLRKQQEDWKATHGNMETELQEHDARKRKLWNAYWGTIRDSSDTNLAMQVARYDSEMKKMDDLEEKLKTTLATGETDYRTYKESWETMSGEMWRKGIKDIKKWDDKLDTVLNKSRELTIKGVYVPPPELTPKGEDHAPGKGAVWQFGGQQPGSPHRHYPAWLAGQEIVVNPRFPEKGLEALLRSGVLRGGAAPAPAPLVGPAIAGAGAAQQGPSNIFHIQAHYAYQSERTLTDFIRTQQLLYGK